MKDIIIKDIKRDISFEATASKLLALGYLEGHIPLTYDEEVIIS